MLLFTITIRCFSNAGACDPQEARKREADAAEFVPETEDDDEDVASGAAAAPAAAASIHRLDAETGEGGGFGLQIMQKVHFSQSYAECRFTGNFDRLPDQNCRSLDRLSDHLALH